MAEISISVGFDERHGLSGKSAEAVIVAVSDITGRSPTELEPLAETIDADALNRLFDTTNGNESRLTVSFRYSGCDISIESNEINVELVDE